MPWFCRLPFLGRFKNGELRSGTGVTLDAYTNGNDSYAYIYACNVAFRSNARFTRDVAGELVDEADFSSQIISLVDDYFDGRGFTHDE